MRNIEENPYTKEEQRVADFIVERSNGAVGGGDDPIGFLLASYALLSAALDKAISTIQEKVTR